MEYGSIYHSTGLVFTCEIAGVVALRALHYLRLNLFRFGEFRHILVEAVGEILINDEQKI